MASPPAWTSSPEILSTPGDFPFFKEFTATITSSRRRETTIQNENKQNKLTPTETGPDQRMNAQKTI